MREEEVNVRDPSPFHDLPVLDGEIIDIWRPSDRRKDPRESITLDELLPELANITLELRHSLLDFCTERPRLLLADPVHLLAHLDVLDLLRGQLDRALHEEGLERVAAGDDGIEEEGSEVGPEGESIAFAGEGRHVSRVVRRIGRLSVEGGARSSVGTVAGDGGTDFGRAAVLGRRSVDVLFDAFFAELHVGSVSRQA